MQLTPRKRTFATFAICFCAYAFSQLDLALFAYAIPAIRKDWSADLKVIGLVLAAAYIVGGILQVFLGHLTDRWGRKRLLFFASGASSIFVALHAIAWGPISLALMRSGAIATGGAIYPATGAMVSEEAPARYRGIYAGALQTAYPFGWFLASLFAAPMLVIYGWRAVFVVALLSLPFLVVIAKWLPESRKFSAMAEGRSATPTLLGSLRTMLAPELRARTVTLFTAQFLFVIAYGGSTFLLPTYFTEYRGLPIDTAAYLVGIGNAVSILGYFGAAYIGEFILTRRTTVVIFTILGALCFLFMIWVPKGFVPTLVTFAIMSIFFYGTAAVKFAYVAESFPTELRATGLAVCGSLAVNLGIAAGPLALSFAVEAIGWQRALSWAVAAPLFGAGALYLLLRPIQSGLDIEHVQQELQISGREGRVG